MAQLIKIKGIRRKRPQDFVDLFVLAVIAYAKQLEEDENAKFGTEKGQDK